MLEFEGKTAVVTGATRGIGRAISEALLARGATVIGLYGGNQEAAEAFAGECSHYGPRLRLRQIDVSDYQAVAAFLPNWKQPGTPWISWSTTPASAGTRCWR
jgi:3-oxoacyl-[acyl-carrier protein] reductase